MIIMGVFTLIFLCLGYYLGYAHKQGINPIEQVREVLKEQPDTEPIQIDDEREYDIEQARKGGGSDWQN